MRERTRLPGLYISTALFLVLTVSFVTTGQDASVWINPLFEPIPWTIHRTMTRLDEGRLVAITDNGVTFSTSDARSWTPKVRILREFAIGERGPGIPNRKGYLLNTKNGLLVYVWMDDRDLDWDERAIEPGPNAKGGLWSIRSTNGGRTWTDRQQISDKIVGHPPEAMVETRHGTIVAPVQYYERSPGRNVLQMYVSTDEGKTWIPGQIIDLGGRGHHDGAMEPTLVELQDGRLWMLIRTTWDRFWEAYSDDGGFTWHSIGPSRIQASASPGTLKRLASGRLVLVWNTLYPEGKNDYPRNRGQIINGTRPVYNEQWSVTAASYHRDEIAIAVSEDDGVTWTRPLVIARKEGDWLAYPRVFEIIDGELWIITGQGGLQVRISEEDLLKALNE